MYKALPVVIFLLLACTQQTPIKESDALKNSALHMGEWLFNLEIDGGFIPFNSVFANTEEGLQWSVVNGEEQINVKEITIAGDSIKMQMPLFNSRYEGVIDSDTTIHGYWFNTNKGLDYKIPFVARYGIKERFKVSNQISQDISGKWEVFFSPDSVDYCKAVGLFKQVGANVTGTFLTETGDYRYLEGIASGNQLQLSCFDGSHAFLFSASLDENGILNGDFWSGIHWHEKWRAKRNADAELTHPDSLTFVKESSHVSRLSFTGINKEPYALDAPELKNKVLIIQILGSWCPNCADESRLFSEIYKTYHKNGLEIVGVSYEKSDNIDEAIVQIKHFKSQIGAPYTFVYGGKVEKGAASKDFYMLSEITSFPTAVFVDRNGKIRRVHTGFYGPGTGEYYTRYKKDLISFLEELLGESVNS
ncbi:MAG TPA: TlpA family protein disulfide reductase [Flavobacteriales bacterium]|nr:TlpA family protein disulfide reductase [Flavobacteriales bacterium]